MHLKPQPHKVPGNLPRLGDRNITICVNTAAGVGLIWKHCFTPWSSSDWTVPSDRSVKVPRKFCPPWHGPNTCENVYTLCICCMLTRGSVPACESKRVERKIKVLHSSKQWPKYRYRGNSPRAGSLAGEQLTEIHHVWIHSLWTQCFTFQHVILQRQLALKTFFYLCSLQSRREKGLM